MGTWLNPGNENFRQMVENAAFYVDKTGMLAHFNQWLFSPQRYVCVSRARRFGKTIAADMVAAYYDKTCDSKALFEPFEIGRDASFEKGLNKFNVLQFDAQTFYHSGDSGEEYVATITHQIQEELLEAWPFCLDGANKTLFGSLERIHQKTGEQFVIIIDEWDSVFRHHTPDSVQRIYVDFLRQIFKSGTTNKFCALAYVTGIFPIVKYNTESAMNLFFEYTMIDSGPLTSFVGFAESEVQSLCKQYQMDFEQCKSWYDGYLLEDMAHVYNPNSIYKAMVRRKFQSYWTATGAYEQISDHITLNFDGLKECVAALMAGGKVPVRTRHFKNKMDDLKNRNDVLTLLIHLGYLGFDEATSECFIPNKEIRLEFEVALEDTQMEGFVDAYKRSAKIMNALLSKDEKTVASEIQKVHDDISSVLTYNRESDLALVIMYACASGRKTYKFVRELPTGTGFADIVMLPMNPGDSAIVWELKWDQSAEGAIDQIKTHRYCDFFEGYRGTVLLCGINYIKGEKIHECMIEEIEVTPNFQLK